MKKDVLYNGYINSAKLFNIAVSKEENHLLILSVLRLVTFIGGLILIWFGFRESNIAGTSVILATSVLFFTLLKLYSIHSAKRDFYRNLSVINQREAEAVTGNLSSFEPGNSYTDIHHDFSYDVDLFGNASVFQYLNRTVTGYGRDILAGWLSDPYGLTFDLKQRQEAIKELALKVKWRHEFMASGMKDPLEKEEISDLLRWMGEASVIVSSDVKKTLIFLLPLAAIITLILVITEVFQYPVFILVFLVNLSFIGFGLKRTNYIHNALSKKYNFLSSMDGLLKSFDNEIFVSEKLNDIKVNISGSKMSAAVSVKKLSRLLQAFDSRMNIIVGFMLNGLFLWDYHCIYRLEKWKSEYGELFSIWLDMLGQIDAYISLGNYSYNNPEFRYPVISDDSRVFSVRSMGHQLIDESKRVCNDFELEKSGTVCIISGANMAGKSTFLRSVAINFILGMTGAPVCAAEMSFKPVKLFTSMRTTDSLSDNESYFYAELKRLKALKSKVEEGEPVFFILDEILKGTNSADKSLGSKLFLERLVISGGTGLIATHDTSLGAMESDHKGLITNKCFEIEIDGETIKFDYKLQNGITKKMNAALLMKQMGILE